MSAARTFIWSVHDDLPADDARVVDSGLGAFNESAAPVADSRPLSCFARTLGGLVVGGAVGRTWGECCELLQLWVEPECRRRGVGTGLVQRFEAHARRRGCRTFYLETFSFQAPQLYRALGYDVELSISGYAPGITRYTMVRRMPAARPDARRPHGGVPVTVAAMRTGAAGHSTATAFVPGGLGTADRRPAAGDGAIRLAQPADAGAVAACVCAAYLPYIARLGRQPGPMLADYARLIETGAVYVTERAQRVIGVLVLEPGDDALVVANVAVLPEEQHAGVGRGLLAFAEHEARRLGHEAIELWTNERMTENQALYARLGYAVFEHRMVDGYARVFMRKPLG
jgi:N-acetylglutamate synthase-like GNAT family acetyltransferase